MTHDALVILRAPDMGTLVPVMRRLPPDWQSKCDDTAWRLTGPEKTISEILLTLASFRLQPIATVRNI